MEKYWEDYKLGERFETTGRTMTDSDIRMFIGATDATHPAHIDEVYAAAHPFGKVVVQGTLTVGVVDGFAVKHLVGQKVRIGHYGYDKIRFLAPVFTGDTLMMRAEVVELRERNDEFGLVTFDYTVTKQDGSTVAVVRDIQMVERKS